LACQAAEQKVDLPGGFAPMEDGYKKYQRDQE